MMNVLSLLIIIQDWKRGRYSYGSLNIFIQSFLDRREGKVVILISRKLSVQKVPPHQTK